MKVRFIVLFGIIPFLFANIAFAVDLTSTASVGSSYTSGQSGVQIPVTMIKSGENLPSGGYVHGKLYFSTNNTWDSGDTVLWSSNDSIPDFPNNTLNSSGSRQVTATVQIPTVSNPGTYYIISYADAPQTGYPIGYYSETSEVNNTSVYSVTINTLFDLTSTASVGSSYTSGQSGVQIPVTMIKSGENLPSGGYVHGKLYFSTNNTWDSGDTVLWSSNDSLPDFPNNTLNSSGSRQVTATVQIPTISSPGTYYIISYADAPQTGYPSGYYSETNEGNNTYSRSVTINTQFDLTSSATVGSSYTSGQSGVQIPVTVSKTGGDLPSGDHVHAKLYFSTNNTWDSGDTVLWSSNDSLPDFPNNTLNSSGSRQVTATVQIPTISSPGTYYIISYADAPQTGYPSGYYSETNEGNNTYSRSVTINTQFDLTSSATVGSSYTSGQSGVQIPVTVSKTGGDLPSGDHVHAKLYFSNDNTWDTGDTVLWSSNDSNPDFPNSTLNISGSETVTATVDIPSGSTGTRYIISYADAPQPENSYPDGYYTETDENNNYTAYSVSIGISNQNPVFVPFYRLYKYDEANNTRDHLYTTSVSERDSAIQMHDYEYEGIECYISINSFQGGIPLYRLYLSAQNSHFFTTSEAERDTKISEGYVLEGAPDGIIGYIYQNSANGLVSIHRLKQQADTPFHYFLTTNQYERTTSLDNGYTEVNPDGIGYVPITVIKDWDAHHRPQANFGGVDLATGAYRGLNSLDLVMKGRGPSLAFAHYYNSFNFNHAPMGMGWSHSLCSTIVEGPDGSTVYVFWGNGTTSKFTKTGPGLSDFKDESGNHQILTLVDDGMNYGYNLLKKSQTVYKFRRFDVYPYGRNKIAILEIEDWKGNKLTFDYQDVTTISDGMGRSLRLSYYYPSGQLQKVEELVGTLVKRTISFSYDAEGLLETFVDANGQTTRFDYFDEPTTLRHKLLKSITYPKGNTVLVDYDELSGKVSSVKDADSIKSTTIEYNPSTGITKVTDPENHIFEKLHTGSLLTAFRGQGDASWTTIDRTDTRNPNLPTRITDKNGNITEYEYDAYGNLTKVKNAAGKIATYEYNDKNNVMESKEFHDALNTSYPKTTYLYDPPGNRLDSITNPENETTSFAYNADVELERITDGRGFQTTFDYDAYGNLEQVTDAENNVTRYENDYAGRTTAAIDAEDIRTQFLYDPNDNPKDIINYTRSGQQLRRIARVYDANSNLDSVSWTNQGVFSQTQYNYDARDRLRSIIKPGNLEKVYAYNEMDLVSSRTDPNNIATQYTYDEHNRLAETIYSDQTKISIDRDQNGNVTSVVCKNGESAFTYNSLNLIETNTDPYGNTVSYNYNDEGRISRITYPGSGKEVNYTYDYAGRLKTVQDWSGGLVTYLYDPAGNLSEIQRSNGLTTAYGYDNASRLTAISEKDSSDTTLWSYAYTLDGVGNHTAVDAVNEPFTATIPEENTIYTNDKTNNRLLSAGSVTYTYDNNGNRKTRTDGAVTTTYSWDYENMLTEIATSGQDAVTYTYDGMNNRIAKAVGSMTTRYILDLNSSMSRVLAETDGSGVVKAYYSYGHGLISRIDASTSSRKFYHFNNRGDTVALSDDTGVITDKYAYDEYGNLLEDPGNSTSNPLKFVARYGVMDESDNVYFMRARYYDSKVGRFLSEDPHGFEGGDWNLYAYVGGNPVNGVDPSGFEKNNFQQGVSTTFEYAKYYLDLIDADVGDPWWWFGKGRDYGLTQTVVYLAGAGSTAAFFVKTLPYVVTIGIGLFSYPEIIDEDPLNYSIDGNYTPGTNEDYFRDNVDTLMRNSTGKYLYREND